MGMEKIDAAKKRCDVVVGKIQRLTGSATVTRTLLKLARSEHSFLSTLSTSPNPPVSLSVNIGHLEAVVHLLELASVNGVSRVCKPLPLPTVGVHVDIVCTLGNAPAWIIVSDRNPRYIFWTGRSGRSQCLRSRVEQVLAAARSTQALKPSSVIFFFANGLPAFVIKRFKDEFGASDFGFVSEGLGFDCDFAEEMEGEWVDVIPSRSFSDSIALQIKLTDSPSLIPNAPTVEVQQDAIKINQDADASFSSVLYSMRWKGDSVGEDPLVNFDTTALIALVSGISNGCADELLARPENELKQRFKGNTEFVIAQAKSELRDPMLVGMKRVLGGRRGIICEGVLSEFRELVSMCGGRHEKHRGDTLLKCLAVVPDHPSARMSALPTTRKLAMKNKIVFGTGDHWRAPTLTANTAFIRAVAQTGMSLFTIEHRPRALMGD